MSAYVIAAGCAAVSGVMFYGAALSERHGHRRLALFRAVCGLWFGRYAVVLASIGLGSSVATLADPWVIVVANGGLALTALMTMAEWREVS